jgi:uncharacterized tellurite resistance protein B-like protein
MFAKLKQLLQLDCHTLSPAEQTHQLNLATVSLLIEVINADQEISQEEMTHLLTLLQTRFSLSEELAKTLFEQGQQAQRDATSLYEFTAQINEHFSLAQKQALVLSMWELSFVDDKLCQYEDQIIRRVADLLHLKHSELIQLRNQANPNI